MASTILGIQSPCQRGWRVSLAAAVVPDCCRLRQPSRSAAGGRDLVHGHGQPGMGPMRGNSIPDQAIRVHGCRESARLLMTTRGGEFTVIWSTTDVRPKPCRDGAVSRVADRQPHRRARRYPNPLPDLPIDRHRRQAARVIACAKVSRKRFSPSDPRDPRAAPWRSEDPRSRLP